MDAQGENSGWQPIEIALKVGRRIIVCLPDSRLHMFLARWVGALDSLWLDGEGANTSATHWMPLPEAPPDA